jgi:hypothetical protein
MKSPTETPTAVDCSRALALLADLKSAVRRSLAAKVLVGKELEAIQKKLGFRRGDASRFFPKTAVAVLGESGPTWGDWCKANLGISDDTAARYQKCFLAVKAKAKDHPETLRLLETPSEKLKGDELAALAARAGQLVCFETETALIKELHEIRDQQRGKKPSKDDQEKEQRAKVHTTADLIFGGIRDNYKKFKTDVRAAFQKSLGMAVQEKLPVRSKNDGELTLEKIRDDLKEMVLDVETDLKALVLILDKQIEKTPPDATGQSKPTTKSKQ